MANKIEVKELLEAGVHFGHMTRKWDPNMAPYIYMERNGIHIINLYKTAAKIEEDNEAFEYWKTKIGVPENRILKLGPKDNYWPANAPAEGPNGPCGPCSEIFFDRGGEKEKDLDKYKK